MSGFNKRGYYGEATCKYNDYVDCNNGDINNNKCKKCGWCPTVQNKRKLKRRRLFQEQNHHKFVFQYKEIL